MSTHDSTHQAPDPADRSGSDGPTSAGAKKKQKWGFEVLLVFPLIALLNAAASPLFSAALSDRLPVALEFDEPTELTLDGVELAVEGLTTLSVPLADLSAWAIGQFIAAKAIWIIGLTVATWFASRAIAEVVQGRPFSARVERGLTGLSWTLVATGPLYALAQVPGDNLVTRDLGLLDMDVNHGVTQAMSYLWIGSVILAELLRRAVKRGHEVQDELEGVI